MNMASTPKITPFLWAQTSATEMAAYYCSILPNTSILSQNGFVVTLDLMGQRLSIMNGGPHSNTFDESVSFMISCKDQEEVDTHWDAFISSGGKESMCGWLQDKYGVFWQIIPEGLPELLGNPDPEKARKATESMMQMRKIDINEMRRAAEA